MPTSMFGLRGGEDVGTLWELHVYWHPGEGRAYIYQVGGDGTLGIGTLEPPAADGSGRSEATFYAPDGTTSRIAHVARNHGDVHETDSLSWVDGAWQPRRTYVWRRVVAKAPPAADAPGDDP